MDIEAMRQRQAELVQVLAVAQSPIELARASGELESLNRQLERVQESAAGKASGEQ
ncbi:MULTISPECIES: hypothetical protein [Actinomycetes]|uniref:hypothetical protein n=1 Tax=Actinomycetes TaxID=1760 RepID=UPI003427278F